MRYSLTIVTALLTLLLIVDIFANNDRRELRAQYEKVIEESLEQQRQVHLRMMKSLAEYMEQRCVNKSLVEAEGA